MHHPELSKSQRIDIIHQKLSDYGLPELIKLLDRHPSELSGGQLQKLALMRAVLVEPAMLIADEPTAMLDIPSTKDMARLIKHIPSRTTALCITHSKTFSDALGIPVVELNNGILIPK